MPKRLTTLAIVIAVSGSPAVLSACMAFCLQDMAPAASHRDSQSAEPAADAATAVPAGPSAHAHHGSPPSNASLATGPATASAHDSIKARVSATCSNCCPQGQDLLVARPGVERLGAKALNATPIASRMASFLVTPPGVGTSPPSPPLPPPAPTTALLVLRI